MAQSVSPQKTSLETILRTAWEEHASDIHLRQDGPVVVRVNGVLIPIEDSVTSAAHIQEFTAPMLSDKQRESFALERAVDLSCEVPGMCRLRVNLFHERHRLCASIRLLPERIPTMDEVYLPRACHNFISLGKGLVLVTGPTGSGKSTTLAAMLNAINRQRPCHILTIEDPIEFLYVDDKAMISQIQVGADAPSFTSALRYSYRQDPDVVLLGEMRDLESMQIAITLAETGHLTFSTLHTGEAAQTISRIVDSFPPHQQEMVRMQLANSLGGVVSQQLLPLKDGTGRVAAREVLVANRGVRNLIRENKLEQIATAIQTGSGDLMFTMNHSLGHLLENGFVDYETAYQASFDRRDFQNRYGKRRGLAGS
ncbi:PilT/PilU family type 4a pilus ATPase [Candidatus Sumerlaeota bacterium]|nr:PilT/PilU family type 4a pilus ATPase [Candidatus Sumerlaeota bacterium]